MLYDSIPKAGDHVEAIAVYPGLGEHWRVTHAIENWEDHPEMRYLLVAGDNPGQKTSIPVDKDSLAKHPFYLMRERGVLAQGITQNTPGQAEWLVEQVDEHNIKSLSLTVSPYHSLRALLTTVKMFDKLDVEPIPIIPVPVLKPPSTITPETGMTAVEMSGQEIPRILAYQKKGDVATPDEFAAYLEYIWQHPIATH
jgi:hypothetical protein